MKTCSASQQVEKVAESSLKEGLKGDNPFRHKLSVIVLSNILNRKNELCSRYELKNEGLDVLMRIGSNWEMGIASTVYGLSIRPKKNDLTSMHHKVKILLERGLIEVSGTGMRNSKTYCPSKKGLEFFSSLLNELD